MGNQVISNEDRSFLALVSEAAFANPFGERRAELNRQIAGGGGKPANHNLNAVVERVHQRLQAFDQAQGQRVVLQDFEGEDQQVMASAYLFDIFHRYSERLDALILRQVQSPDELVEVSFAGQALGDLRERGFAYEQATRLFSLFYQIRRAFHFIDRGLIGVCASMRRLREQLWNTIFTRDIERYEQLLWDRMEDFSILLLGPTGAGKGAAASAVGRSGYIPFDERKGVFAKCFMQTFVSVNLTQYAETLLESELFGHAKGAFTGAVASHEGLLSLCGHHGSIFLDEIGDISPTIQIKLLKVLEERRFTPVGSHKEARFYGRVIAATHQPVAILREQGRFRDDFYYRLCSDCIRMPGLAQRIREDKRELDLMIAHTVERVMGGPSEALQALVRQVVDEQLGPDYPWPGNVRELSQCVRRVIIRGAYEGDQTPARSGPADQIAEDLRAGRFTAEQLVAHYCASLYERLGTYEEVARRTDLDRRTVKRYLQRHSEAPPAEAGN
jgi:DNA-binding NtrC family response regulator